MATNEVIILSDSLDLSMLPNQAAPNDRQVGVCSWLGSSDSQKWHLFDAVYTSKQVLVFCPSRFVTYYAIAHTCGFIVEDFKI